MKKDSEAEGKGIKLENEYGTGKFRVRKCGTHCIMSRMPISDTQLASRPRETSTLVKQIHVSQKQRNVPLWTSQVKEKARECLSVG